MGQYIPISTSVSAPISYNIILLTLLRYIGEEYKRRHSNVRIDEFDSIKVGMIWVDQECQKQHIKALKRILYSKNKKTLTGMEYRKWSFHRTKVRHCLFHLYKILEFCEAPKEIRDLFKQLDIQLKDLYVSNHSGGEMAALPYYSELDDAIYDSERTEKDKVALSKILSEFNRFDSFYS